MSGKKQKVIPGWFDCSKCKKRFSRQLATKHAGEDAACVTVYPYLKEGKLFCLLNNVTPNTRKIGDLPFIKNKRLASSTIFLSEELIRETGLVTFGWVSLSPLTCQAGNKSESASFTSIGDESHVDVYDIPSSSYAFRVWPIPESIGVGSSGQCNLLTVLSLDGFGTNKLVPSTSKDNSGSGDAAPGVASIRVLSSSVKSADEIFSSASQVTLVIENFDEVDEVSFDVERFIQSFRTLFQGRPIALNNRFKMRFYAQFIHFYIGKLISSDSQSNDDNETFGLEKLSLKNPTENSFFQITPSTQIDVIAKDGVNIGANDILEPAITLKQVGGLSSLLKEICSTVKFILSTDLNVPKGILLYGHIGVGKSLVAQAVANEFKLFKLYYEEFQSVHLGNKSKDSSIRSNSLEKIFKDAISRAPSVIIVDGLDIVSAKKNSDAGTAPVTKFASDFSRLVTSPQFKQSKVLILCTATDTERVDSNIRSPKIFAKEIEIPVPSAPERGEILSKIISGMDHSLSDDYVKVIAASTHGFVAADLRSLCNQAALNALSKRDVSSCDRFPITMTNIQDCMKTVKPSAVKSILIDVPNVKWDDIGGQDDLKFKLKQAIEWPLKHPESFKRLGITPPKGILMYGPPGCSKTMIAKAIATESGLNFISVKGSELFSKWVGESEKAVQAIFRKARQVAPCVVFFDEIDSLGGERGSTSGSSNVHERVLAQILVEIDGIEALKDVTIVAATNRPDRIDQALLRPGRLDRIVYVPLPCANTRREILKIRFNKMPIDQEEVDIEELVKATEGYSGAELTAVCHEAALKALEEDITTEVIKQRHFSQALRVVKPRITQDQINFYENYSISRKKT